MKRFSTLTILVLIVTVLYGLRPTEIQAAVKEYGPYASVFNFSVSDNHWATQVYKGNYPNLESFFVVDGKEYGPYSLSYFNPIVSDNGWVFPYETSDKKLMVRVSNGQEYGPYTNINIRDDHLQMAGTNWGFIRTQIDPFQQFVVINGKEYGPYNSVETLRIGEGVWAYVYQKNKDSEYRVNVNGTDYGYYKSYLDVNVYVKGTSWGLIHRSSSVSNAQEQTTFIINGKTYGPYDVDATTNNSYSQLALTEKRWGYVYKQNGVYHMIIDGNEYTTTEDVTSLQIGDELWGYRYVISGEPTINLAGERTTSFIVVNGKKYGPFTEASDFFLADTVWGVDYIKDGQLFVHYNNTDYGPYPWAGSGAASTFSASDNHWGIQYTRLDGFFVIVDGVEYGPFAGGLRMSDTVWALRTSNVNVPETNERDYIVISTDKPLPPVDTNARPDDSVNYWGVEENSNTQHRAITNTQLYNTIKGKIILKVEDVGKAYYVHPTTKRAHYLGRPDDAFAVMREQGVGITNANLAKIPVGLNNLTGPDSDGDGLPDLFEDAIGTSKNNPDSDGDGYDDKTELGGNYNPSGSGKLNLDNNFSGAQKGKIFLQVERNGEAWYVNPADGKKYFLGRPADAFQVMRNLGLGISNNNFDKL